MPNNYPPGHNSWETDNDDDRPKPDDEYSNLDEEEDEIEIMFPADDEMGSIDDGF